MEIFAAGGYPDTYNLLAASNWNTRDYTLTQATLV